MFELYESLRQSADVNFKFDNLETNISSLDKEGQTTVFCLVYYDCKLKNTACPVLEENVSMDLNTLSDELQNILYKFSQLHLQKMNEHFERSLSNK